VSETVALMALCRIPGMPWHLVAREAQRGGLEALHDGRVSERSPEADDAVAALRANIGGLPRYRDDVAKMLAAVDAAGDIRVTTVLDDDYPANLRTIHNLPPFLFYRGSLHPDDAWSVAVVGTRDASEEGVARTRRLVARLVAAGVTVLSGLARGIDTAAHEACLDAGGRTIAVIGTGIRRTYPPENAGLADRIAATGAVVSQFWPDSPPTRGSFPRRNVTMSAMAQGTVVIEASGTSGARLQARFALEQGRRVFLPRSLVMSRDWARRYLERPGAVQVENPEDIVALLQSTQMIQARSEARRQLTLSLA